MDMSPVDDISEGLLAVGRVDRGAGVAGNEVGGVME